MPAKRKPTDTIQINLRLKEHLRRRLEAAAKARQVSLNYEMASRLERSLAGESELSLFMVAQDIERNWLNFAERHLQLSLENDLVEGVQELTRALQETIGEIESGQADLAVLAKLRRANTSVHNVAVTLLNARDLQARRKAALEREQHEREQQEAEARRRGRSSAGGRS